MKIYSYFNDNEDVLLLNVQYVAPIMKEDNTWTNGTLYLIYRDNKTKQKKVRVVKDPECETFITKPEHRRDFKTQRRYMRIEDVDSHIVPYRKLDKFVKTEIKNDGTDIEYLKVCDAFKKESFKWRHSYFADYDIRDYAMMSYIIQQQELKRELNTNISTTFLDIESDVYGMSSMEMDNGAAPINAVSIVIANDVDGTRLEHPIVCTFLLRNYERYKEQEYLEKHLDKFIEECHEEFDEKYHTPEFRIMFYNDEIKLLRSLFKVLHSVKSDFILIWNMQYDINQIIKRLTFLGENPIDYFCHPDFEEQKIKYNFDEIYKNDIKNSSDSFDCTSYSLWIDQMRNYAGIRKSYSDYGGNNLDNVSRIELNSQKRRYSKKTVTVLNGAIEETWNFVKYSINDVLLQYGIEEKTEDTITLFEQSLYGGTRFSKTLKQTVYLKNVFAIDYIQKNNIVPMNNINVNNTSSYKLDDEYDNTTTENDQTSYDDIQLRGALVADPILNDYNGETILGEKSFTIFKYVADMDYSSMYPNAKITANMGMQTQKGRIIIPDILIDDENPDNDPKFMRGGKYIEDLTTDDGCNTGRWLKLKSAYDYIKEFGETNS